MFFTFLPARRAHVDQHGMEVRVERGWQPALGWVLPEPPPGVAITGDVASIAGWYVLVLRAAVGAFELSAPVWWGPRERTPELGRARGEAVGAPDGTVRVRISLRRPV